MAEKLHAYTQTYEGGRGSPRVKDLVDLALIAELASLDAAALRREIEASFGRRETHSAPRPLPSPPPEWALPYGRLAEEVGISGDLAAGHREASAMLDPVLREEITEGGWSPDERAWSGEARKRSLGSIGRRPVEVADDFVGSSVGSNLGKNTP